MTTTAIFGGSFNPVHNAHMALALAVLRERLADEVWFVPCRRNPLKNEPPLFSDQDRLNMLRLSIEAQESPERERMKVCDIEYHMPEPSYTADTLLQIASLFPDRRFRLLIGGDSLAGFHKWSRPHVITEIAPLIVYPRPGITVNPCDCPPGTTILRDIQLSSISATEIRQRLAEGKDTEGMLNKSVENYILNMMHAATGRPG